MKGKLGIALAALLIAAVLSGCQNTTGSYNDDQQQLDALTQRVEALEQENETLRDEVNALTDTIARQQEELADQQQTIEEQQQTLDEQQEMLKSLDTVREWAQEAKEQAGTIAGTLREEFTDWFTRIEYEYNESRVIGMGAESQLGLLLAITTDDGQYAVTFDPVEWNSEDGEEKGYIINEKLNDVQTLTVAEDTFYAILDGSTLEPVTYAQLTEKAGGTNPLPFTFYILDDQVYMIVEKYLP